MSREFFIQRYAVGQWPYVRGELPWVVRGPNFEKGFEIAYDFDELPPGREVRRVIAEELLYEGVLTTAWVVSGNIPNVLPIGEALDKSLAEVTFQIGYWSDWSSEVLYLLELTPSLSDYASYVAEDRLRVVPMSTPTR